LFATDHAAEARFRTAKNCASWPAWPSETREDARAERRHRAPTTNFLSRDRIPRNIVTSSHRAVAMHAKAIRVRIVGGRHQPEAR